MSQGEELADGGHVVGNFPNYYSFNPAGNRLVHLHSDLLLQLMAAATVAYKEETEASSATTGGDLIQKGFICSNGRGFEACREKHIVGIKCNDHPTVNKECFVFCDIGCNEGDLTLALYEKFHELGLSKQENRISNCVEPRSASETSMTDRFDSAAEKREQCQLQFVSELNTYAQKRKLSIAYRFEEIEVGSSEVRHETSRCQRIGRCVRARVMVDGEEVGHGIGNTKKRAKEAAAKHVYRSVLRGHEAPTWRASEAVTSPPDAGSSALKEAFLSQSSLKHDDASSGTSLCQCWRTIESNCLRKKVTVSVFGVDLDSNLVARAIDKASLRWPDAVLNGTIAFQDANVTHRENLQVIFENFLRPWKKKKFDLITCFSVTMWVHLNHGDEGLQTFLKTISSRGNYVLLEAQPWKCYRDAVSRMRRRHLPVSAFFDGLQWRDNVVEMIDNFLLSECHFTHRKLLGETAWGRGMVLYCRC